MNVLLVVGESVMHERMGVMSLGASLSQAGFGVHLAVASRYRVAGMRALMDRLQPEVVGYSSMTGEHCRLLALNARLKEDYRFISVFGGPHATFFPRLVDEPGLDAICRGEGDVAFVEFCRRVACGEDWEATPNFVARRHGRTIENPLLPLIDDLDSLPFPDRELMYEADPSLRAESHKVFFATRGCPYDCSYCFNHRYGELYRGMGPMVRHRSPEKVVDEIDEVRSRYPLGVVWIDDDTFLLKPHGWMERFARAYRQRIGLPLSCNVRADLVTESVIRLLRDAGLNSVWMGVECGNEEVSRRILRRNLSTDQIRAAAGVLRDAGVMVVTQNLLGLPVDKPYEIDKETLDLNLRIRPTYAWSSILYPYPGTAIEAYAREHGFLTGEPHYLETNKRTSMLKFPSPRVRRRIENLHKLFGLMARFPALRRLCDRLCDAPLDGMYTPLYYLWYGYIVKARLYPFRSPFRELGNYIGLWWRFVRKR
ncbi:B12-binding domain-containing radical SAM protein [Candidatus Fermentibacteria bacterium]|nr:B12-binding domain-containing radical SAM protein [Candidatus Fermentibacteria bacterium]